jgi:hypothetical protein
MQSDYRWAETHQYGVNYYCYDEGASLIAAAAFSIAQDFVTWLMPFILFPKLRIPLRQKISLGILFAIGML